MILIDIKTAIAERIKSIGGIVIASEVKEGFAKPAYFIDILPADIETQNVFYELATVNVEIRYIPLLETSEACIIVSQTLKEMFADPLKVDDRYLNAEGLTFEMDASALILNFNITFMQNTNATLPEYEKMQDIKISEELRTDGVTTNSN